MLVVIDPEFVKSLNLLDGAPRFVIRVDAKTQKCTVLNPEKIPDNDGAYLVHGTTILANGTRVRSVFNVNTDSGGTFMAVFWKVGTCWMDSQDINIPEAFGIDRVDMFPFDWEFSVPLENDIFHPKDQ